MHKRSKAIISAVLSCSLAFSPLTRVAYALGEDQSVSAIELTGDDGANTTTDQGAESTATSDDRVVMLTDEPAPVVEDQQGEQAAEEEPVPTFAEHDGVMIDAEAKKHEDKTPDTDRDKVADANEIGKLDVAGENGVAYVDAQENQNVDNAAETVTAETKAMESKLYVVREDVTCKDRITVKGETKLVICNDCTLTCPKGITVANGGHLIIYRQSVPEGATAGTLVCETKGSKVAALSVNEGSSLTIEGGHVTATCKTNDGAGIGGDKGKNAGDITINGGVVEASSKMNGAGIGGGKDGDGGTTTITGGNVTAVAGDEDGAGIGGGEDGDGGTITISGAGVTVAETDENGNPASYDCATTVSATGAKDAAGIGGGCKGKGGTITIDGALVTANGVGNAAGIGGGDRAAAGSIDIKNGANVSAVGGGGAGIGTGSAKLQDSNPSRVIGGTINISDSTVSAISSTGGAGIGGGIFGHVDSINISGGTTVAMGGMFLGPGTISAAFQAGAIINGIAGDLWAGSKAGSICVKIIFTPLTLLAFIGDIVNLFADKPEIIYYTGAGIGGGYHEASGDIHISNDATVTATAGMLPPNDVLKKLFKLSGADKMLSFKAPDQSKRSSAIGNGAGYNKDATVSLYDSAVVATTTATLKVADGHSVKELDGLDLKDFDKVKNIMGAMLDKDLNPNPPATTSGAAGAQAVAKNNVASIMPTAAVCFDANAEDAWGTMEMQTSVSTAPLTLAPCSFVRDGYTFEGWATSPDGDVVYADGASVTIGHGGVTTLYAKWSPNPSCELATLTYSIRFGDTTDVNFYLKDLVDDPSNYAIEWSDNGEGAQTVTPARKDRNGYTLAKRTAEQMADETEVVVKHKEADGTWKEIERKKVSVKTYCDSVIRKSGKVRDTYTAEQTTKLAELCKATLDFGAYAQKALDYRTELLANAHPGGGDWFNVQGVEVPEPSMVKSSEDSVPAGLSFDDAGLEMMRDDALYAIWFGYSTTERKQGYAFGATDANGKELGREGYTVRDGGDRFVFTLNGIVAKDLDKKVTVRVSRDGKAFEISASAVDCMGAAIADENTTDAVKDMARAMYNYHLKAKACAE